MTDTNYANFTSDQRKANIARGPRARLDDSKRHLRITNGRTFSYSTCIVDVLPNGQTIGNDTYYSATTTRHQQKAGVRGCDVVVVGVPEGTADLAGWFRYSYPALVANDQLFFKTGSIDPDLFAIIRQYQAEMGIALP